MYDILAKWQVLRYTAFPPRILSDIYLTIYTIRILMYDNIYMYFVFYTGWLYRINRREELGAGFGARGGFTVLQETEPGWLHFKFLLSPSNDLHCFGLWR